MTLTHEPVRPDAPGSSGIPAAAPVAACLNCATPLTGRFCAACGQRDIPAYPGLRELAADAFAELAGWDGRIATTLRTLVRRPGELTLAFLQGRRARHVSPVRLYLMASLAYFLLAAGSPEVRFRSDSPRPDASAGPLSAEDREAMLRFIPNAPAVLRPMLQRAADDPGRLQRDILETLPRLLFALLPIFAGIVALFYRGRKYPEHLYFALHLNAFVFLALAAIELTKYTRLVPIMIVAGAMVLAVLPVYATLAFRRVYGGTLPATLAREAGIVAVYVMLFMAAFVAMLHWLSLGG